MPVKLLQDGHFIKKGNTWIITIKQKNHDAIKPFLNQKVDFEITVNKKSK